jgi:septal ring factor EnvC (AmiA/AmiB activator)
MTPPPQSWPLCSPAAKACRRLLLAAAVAAAVAAAHPPATGQPAPENAPAPSADRLREEADALQLNLREREADLERNARQQEDILTALDRTNRMLQRYQRQAAVLAEELEELDQKIASTEAAGEDLERRTDVLRRFLSQRLVTLYKTSRLGAMHVLTPADSVVELLKRKTALERILAHDEQTRQTMAAQQAELQELKARLRRHQEDKRAGMAAYERQTAAAQAERSKREALLAGIRDRQEIQRIAIDALKEAARDLERKIQNLSRGPERQALRPPPPSKPLAASKGLLIFPVKGKIRHSYGPYRHPRLNLHAFRNGIDIAADRGEPVRAVHAGTVLYASWFKAYGNIIVIDHGDNYYTVYAHLEDVFKSADNRVESGDVIATVGDSGAMGVAGLYFEIRHHDRPLDPEEWLQKG